MENEKQIGADSSAQREIEKLIIEKITKKSYSENIEKRILDYVYQNFPEDSEERKGPVGIFISK